MVGKTPPEHGMKGGLVGLVGLSRRLFGWHPWQYAAISIAGLCGMLVLEGWLHSLMLALAACPVLIAVVSCIIGWNNTEAAPKEAVETF